MDEQQLERYIQERVVPAILRIANRSNIDISVFNLTDAVRIVSVQAFRLVNRVRVEYELAGDLNDISGLAAVFSDDTASWRDFPQPNNSKGSFDLPRNDRGSPNGASVYLHVYSNSKDDWIVSGAEFSGKDG